MRFAVIGATFCCLLAPAFHANAEPDVSFPVGLTAGYGWSPDIGPSVGARGGVRGQWFYAGLKLDKCFGSDGRSAAFAGPELGVAARVPIVVAMATISGGMALLDAEETETQTYVAPGVTLISAPSSPIHPWFLGVDARYVWSPDSSFDGGTMLLGWVGIVLAAGEQRVHGR